jgi:hypothetical protein
VVAGIVARTNEVLDAEDKAMPLIKRYWYTVFPRNPARMILGQSALDGASRLPEDLRTRSNSKAAQQSLTALNWSGVKPDSASLTAIPLMPR